MQLSCPFQPNLCLILLVPRPSCEDCSSLCPLSDLADLTLCTSRWPVLPDGHLVSLYLGTVICLVRLFEWQVDLSCGCMTLFLTPQVCAAHLFLCMLLFLFSLVLCIYLFYFWLCYGGFSAVAETRGSSLAVVLGLNSCVIQA